MLVRGGPPDVKAHQGTIAETASLAGGHDHRPLCSRNETCDGTLARRVGRLQILTIEQQSTVAQHGLARPEPRERCQLSGVSRQRMNRQDVQVEPERRAGRGGNGLPGGPLGTAQLHQRKGLWVHSPPHGCDALGDRLLRRDQVVHDGQQLDESDQSIVEMRDTGQEVEDPLVDPQRTRRECAARADLHQPPVAQRRSRRERAPVWVGQRR